MHVVSADAVLGPYWPALGILRATPGALRGPGHNSIVASPDGTKPIVYHA